MHVVQKLMFRHADTSTLHHLFFLDHRPQNEYELRSPMARCFISMP